MSFARKLQELRQQHDLSQENLAELLNVSRQSVSKWERGKGYPEMDKLLFLSNYFGVTLDELLKDPDTPTNTGGKRRPINLTKPSANSVKEIYPDKSGPREAHPYNSEVREAYPGESPVQEIYPDADIPRFKVASEAPNDIAQYGNYSCTPQWSSNTQSVSKGRSRKRKSKNLPIFIVIFILVLSAILISFIIAANITRQSSNIDTVSVPDPEIYYEDDYVYEYDYTDQYSIKCCIDQATETRYIFDNEFGNGIVTTLNPDEYVEYIELLDLESGNTIYGYDWYYWDNPVLSVNNKTYVIPEYMLLNYISPEESGDHVIASDTENRQYFVPKYILEAFDALMAEADSENNEDPENIENDENIENAEDEDNGEVPVSGF
ncbi:MAG: helix-turn-helix transcriptional regulator [Ruminococcus sp.]|nr:helix-turn-helix transcriptional regulator [Ruminococcus sp.]